MKNIVKKMALVCAALSLALLAQTFGPRLIRAAYDNNTATGYTNVRVGNLKLTDSGLYDSAGTLRYTPGADNHFVGNSSVTGGQQSLGSVGVALSTNNTTGFSSGNLYYAYLAGATAAVEGSVLVATTSASGALVSVIVAPATVGLTNVVGCASAAVSTGSVVGVYSSGSWAMCLTTGTVVTGDQLATSSLAAGYLYAPTSGTNSLLASTSTVAVALTAGTSAGARARVRLK